MRFLVIVHVVDMRLEIETETEDDAWTLARSIFHGAFDRENPEFSVEVKEE